MTPVRSVSIAIALTLGALLLGGLLGFGAIKAVKAAEPIPAREISVGPESRSALTLTVYNQNLALVGERRRVEFAAGENDLAILDVSRQLRPETVILSGEGLLLVEQGFDVDLMTARRLLDRALGGRVWVRRERPDGEGPEGELVKYVEGTLVSIAEQPLVRIGDKLEQVPQGDIVFEAEIARAGFRDRPTLFATLESDTAGTRELGIAYLTGGLSWQADYVAALNAAEDRLDLAALITVSNNSGTDFADAALRLVAGQVNQVGGQLYAAKAERMQTMDAAMAAPAPSQPIGDQHIYSPERRIDLDDGETKQVGLLDAAGVAVVKEYRFETLINGYGGAEEVGPVKAQVVLEIENEEAGGLGQALPEGVVRVYEAGPPAPGASPGATGEEEAAPVFLGEDRISHTAEGETIRLGIGSAFDVTGRSRQTAFERISDRTYELAQEVTVKNAKETAVEVIVVGQMPPGWRMIDESLPHEEETATRLAWTLPVPAGGEAGFSFRIRVTRQ